MKITDYINGKVSYDEGCVWINDLMILQVRGWGNIQYILPTQKEAEAFQDQVGQFIADAINEKIEREKLKD